MGLTFTTISSSASVKTYSGTPSILRGKWYRSKIKYYNKFPTFTYYHITKQDFTFQISQSDDYGVFGDTTFYEKIGPRHWAIAGVEPYSQKGWIAYEVKASKSYKTISVKGPWSTNEEYNRAKWHYYYRFYHFPRWHGQAIR